MNHGRMEKTWDYVCSIIAVTINMNRDTKKSSCSPDDLHPMVISTENDVFEITEKNIELLRQEFVRK